MKPVMRAGPNAAWNLALALAMVHLVSSLDRHLLSLVLSPIKTELGLSDTQLGFLHGTAYVLLYAAAIVPLGYLVDRFDRRRIIQAGILAWTVGTVACALAQSYPQLVLARMLVGLGQAALVPAATSLLADSFAGRGIGKPIAVFTSAATFGRGLALLGGGVALGWIGLWGPGSPLASLAPWRTLLLLSLILNLVAFAWLSAMDETPRSQGNAPRPPGMFAAAAGRWGTYLAYLGASAAAILLVQVTAAWGPTLLVRGFDLTPAASGLLFGPIVVGFGPAGNVFGGWAIDALTRRGVRAPSAWAAIVALPAALFAGAVFCLSADLVVALCALAAITFCLGFTTPAGLVAIQRMTPPGLRGRATGLFVLIVTMVSLGLGPLTVGWFSDHVFTGPAGLRQAILAVLALGALLGTLSALQAARLERLAGPDLPGDAGARAGVPNGARKLRA
ncbi:MULTISPECIES: MFS transporter [Aurantimonas]|uniref:MFS transporter n=1 Tax=Aurantimonas TaxID=182269 RepID=UPI0009DBC806|nr:MFS transporter [Aurantimonas coralicida]